MCARLVAVVEELMCRLAILIECKQGSVYVQARAFMERNESDMQLVCELLITISFLLLPPAHIQHHYLISFTTQLEPLTGATSPPSYDSAMAMNT